MVSVEEVRRGDSRRSRTEIQPRALSVAGLCGTVRHRIGSEAARPGTTFANSFTAGQTPRKAFGQRVYFQGIGER